MAVSLSKISFIDQFMKQLGIISIAAVVISFVAIVYLGYEWSSIRTTIIEETKVLAQKEAEIARKEIDTQLKFAMQTSLELADDLTSGKLPYKQIDGVLKNKFISTRDDQSKSSFFAVSVAFRRGIYDKNQPQQLKNWYYYYDKKLSTIMNRERDHDYTTRATVKRNVEWFVKPVESGQAMWEEPRFSSTTHEFIAGYSVPFYTAADKKQIAGVVYINYSMSEIKKIMHERSFMKTGYGVVFSQKDKLIYHPNDIAVKGVNSRQRQDNDIQQILKDNEIDTIYYLQKIKKDAQYTLPNGEQAWIFSSVIPSTNWQLKVIFLLNELNLEEKSLNNQLNFIAAFVIFISSLLLRVFSSNRNNLRILWIISIAVTLLFIIAIARLWSISNGLSPFSPNGAVKLKTRANIDTFQRKYDKLSEALELKKPIYVPTGVFFKSAEFVGANNVNISAYVWQKYHFGFDELEKIKDIEDRDSICNYESDSIPKTKGVSFIEAIETEIDFNCPQATYITHDSAGNVTIGWYIKLNLRQEFDYSKYPFDKNIIWLRMNHSDFKRNMVLIPDTHAYRLLYESAKSGIDLKGFILPGWQLSGSYFSEVTAAYNSDWGIEDFVGQFTPELYFNVEINRDFLDPFVSGVTPVIMVFLVLFIVIFASSDKEELAEKFGFDAMTVFAILAGLLFSVALWHGGLRTTLASAKVSYFECFFIVCYFLIVLVGVNSLILSSQYSAKWLRYKDNLFVKLSFLPLTAAMVFFATLVMLF